MSSLLDSAVPISSYRSGLGNRITDLMLGWRAAVFFNATYAMRDIEWFTSTRGNESYGWAYRELGLANGEVMTIPEFPKVNVPQSVP